MIGKQTLLWVACLMAAIAAGGSIASADDPAGEKLRVAVAPLTAAAEWNGERTTGMIVDVWDNLASRLGVATEFVRAPSFFDFFDQLGDGKVDVALGPLAITEEREKKIDFTHSIFHSGLRVAVRQRNSTGFVAALGSLVTWRLVGLLVVVVGLVLLSGHVLWWFERKGNEHSFPRQYLRGVGEAIWWTISAIVTGGCDDKHVDSLLGRIIAFLWMVGGIGLIAAFTSILTATMTADRVTGTIHGPRDLATRTVGCQARSVAVDAVRQRGAIVEEFATIDEAFDALALGMVEAVAGENQQMMFVVNRRAQAAIKLVGPIFESFDYGLGLQQDSPMRERLNSGILRMREDGTLDRIREQWLGQHD